MSWNSVSGVLAELLERLLWVIDGKLIPVKSTCCFLNILQENIFVYFQHLDLLALPISSPRTIAMSLRRGYANWFKGSTFISEAGEETWNHQLELTKS